MTRLIKRWRAYRSARQFKAGRRWAIEMIESGEGPVIEACCSGQDTPFCRGARAAVREFKRACGEEP